MGSQSDAFTSQSFRLTNLKSQPNACGKNRGLALASACSFAAMSLACGVGSAHAADNSINTLLEEVEVVARKRGDAERLQDVPVAATAYSGDQLEALQTRDLESLAFKMPNVQMDDAGTIKSTANFTVRGLGVNSSIPSIDPTVGVFVDGMYMGINAGVILDLFDLEGIEVLRGPQGLLFGRNVTGGAVVVKTAKPTEEFVSKVRFSTTAQQETNLAGTVSGQISEGINGRLTAYYSDDNGWFENKATGNDVGASTTWFVRPSFTVALGESADLIVRLEKGHVDGDGPIGQNRGDSSQAIAESAGVTDWDNSEDSFEVAIDQEGWAETDWTQAIAEYNQDVAFGNGTITNILAWRDYETAGEGDIDSLPLHLFHSYSLIDQDQLSNELRYSGRFGNTSVTSGVYWFSQDLKYIEQRDLLGGALVMTGGGVQDHTAKGVFTQADIDLNESWVLTLGGRYSIEEKDADIASIIPIPGLNECDRQACTAYDYSDSEEWSAFTPKVGLQWLMNDSAQAYAVWTKGFRSGGYNMRNTGIDPNNGLPYVPGPTDQEEQNSFEIGSKVQWADGRVKTNFALFHNTIDDMQRELNLPNAISGVTQLIRNTADATIQGFEFEMMAAATDNLLLTMNLGYVDGEYDDIWLDISGTDGVIDEEDYALDIPRLAPWTYGVGMVHDLQLGNWGALTSRINYNHRDASAYTDNNLGMLSEVDMVDFSIGFAPDSGNYRVALFGKNMLDEVSEGNDTQLPGMLGPVPLGPNSTFTPLNRGRIVGIELNYEI